MKPRTLVIKTLNFDNPERTPRHLWTLPLAQKMYPDYLIKIAEDFPDDIISAPPLYKNVNPNTINSYNWDGEAYSKGSFLDDWGCTFEKIQEGLWGEVKKPLIESWNDIDKVNIPYHYLDIKKDEINSFCKESDKFIIAPPLPVDLPRPFERMQFLRGTAELYMDLIDLPQQLTILIEKIHDFYLKVIDSWCSLNIDGFMFMDDWGSQNSLLISPELWRKIFKPLYSDYVKAVHDKGKYILFHSDGNITEIFGDLVEIGIDAVNSQVFCMDMEDLGKKYSGKITFWGEIDRQHILPLGSPEEIEKSAKRVHSCFYSNGGVIAQCEFGPWAKPENIYKVFEVWNNL